MPAILISGFGVPGKCAPFEGYCFVWMLTIFGACSPLIFGPLLVMLSTFNKLARFRKLMLWACVVLPALTSLYVIILMSS